MLGVGLSLPQAALRRRVPASPAAFTPADLFASGEAGAWYDPSDLSTLWQDTAGTTAVTADGQSVARIDDKSGNGNNLTQATASKRPVYKTAGGLHWLLTDGVDDVIAGSPGAFTSQSILCAAKSEHTTGNTRRFWGRAATSQQAGIFDNSGAWGYFSTEAGTVAALGGDCRTTAGVVSITSSGAANAIPYVNGVAGSTFDPHDSLTSGTEYALGAGDSAGNQSINSKQYGFIGINRVLSSAERQDAENWLAGKAGITL